VALTRRRTAAKNKPIDKRAAILDAALTEFAAHGYRATSTNAIIKRAGVAKGLIFHYFGSKEALYVAVVEDVADQFTSRMSKYLQTAPADLFERVLGWSQVKLELIAEDPRRLRVLVNALAEAPEEIRGRIRARVEEEGKPRLADLLQGIDTSRLRPGVTVKDAIDILTLLAAGFERLQMPLMSARTDKGAGVMDATMVETRRMFELLRDGLYR
jgi:AcrR family transcriptional regulator